MTEFVLHMHNHAGWHTQTIEAASIAEAITKGLDARAGFLSREYAGRYRVEHDDPKADHPRFRVIWDDDEPKAFAFGWTRYKGDVWWSDRFQIGAADDCQACGGTGQNHYSPFHQCWNCGDPKAEGRSSGKQPKPVAA